MKKLVLSLIVLSALVPASSALAGPLTPVQVSDWVVNDDSNAGYSSAASSPLTGNSLVVYLFVDGSTPGYYSQLLDSAGNAVGSRALLNTGTIGYQQPGVAWDPSTGGWLACWGQEVPTPREILCQKIGNDGVPAGAPSVVATIPDKYFLVTPVWSSAKRQFLVTASDYYDVLATWVDSDGVATGSPIDFAPNSGFQGNGGSGLAYSSKSNRFMAYMRGRPEGSTDAWAPWLWLLDGDGNPVGSPQRIDADTTLNYSNATVTWDPVKDEFVLMSVGFPTDPEFTIQRYRASDGSPVGTVQKKVLLASDYKVNRWRPQLSLNPFAGEGLSLVNLRPDATDINGLYSMDVGSDGAMSTPALIVGGSASFQTGQRPWATFNPYTCEYLGAYRGKDTAGAGISQLYTVRYTQSAPCKSALSVTKAGGGSGSVSGTATESGVLGLAPQSVGEGTTELYRSTSVTLTATAAAGSNFDGWSGACSGAGECTVSMSEARSVTAAFSSPTPSNSFTVRTPLLVGTAIRTLVRVPGAGVVRQAGTFRSGGKTRRACGPVSRSVSAAGTVRLRCSLTDAARSARRKGAVRVRLATTFTPTGGTARVVVRTVVLRSLKPKYTG